MAEPTPPETDSSDDKTWVVALIVFGLMGIGGPLIALILFFLIANLT